MVSILVFVVFIHIKCQETNINSYLFCKKINRSNNIAECSAFEGNVLGIDQNQWEKLTNGMCSTTPKQYVKKVHKKPLHCQKQNWLLVR